MFSKPCQFAHTDFLSFQSNRLSFHTDFVRCQSVQSICTHWFSASLSNRLNLHTNILRVQSNRHLNLHTLSDFLRFQSNGLNLLTLIFCVFSQTISAMICTHSVIFYVFSQTISICTHWSSSQTVSICTHWFSTLSNRTDFLRFQSNRLSLHTLIFYVIKPYWFSTFSVKPSQSVARLPLNVSPKLFHSHESSSCPPSSLFYTCCDLQARFS